MVRFFLVALFLYLPATSTSAQCTKDIECKGDRICVNGECVQPGTTGNPVPQPAVIEANTGNTIDDLTSAERMEYDNKKLSIETRGQGYGGFGAGTISMSTWTNWYAYEGFKKISEAEFFLITGHKDEAAQASAKKSRSVTFWLVGMGAMAVGGVTMGGNFAVGLPIFMVGAVLTPIGAFGFTGNKFPYSTVANITDGYNNVLINEIIARRN